ncbi:MAG TPA: glutathione S-transferase family protein [Solirubrobacteraceae bacterium]|nr:glutathione S-transferase family protein [Solirubrobacteraceae bacterium]
MRVIHREHAGRPIRVAWTLEELGEPYELTTMTREESRAAEHLARHPLGRVPVLESDEGFLFESAAICLYLADLHPDAGLVPEVGTHDRALVYQWTVFSPAEIEPPLIEAAMYTEKDPERAAIARGRVDAAARAVVDALDGNEFLVGGRFTIADVLVGSTLSWPARAGHAELLPDGVKDYIERLSRRPAYQRADARMSS